MDTSKKLKHWTQKHDPTFGMSVGVCLDGTDTPQVVPEDPGRHIGR